MTESAKTLTVRYKKGYTLLELIISVTIIVVVFTIGLANYQSFARRQTLVGATAKIRTDLRLVQELALAARKPEGGVCDSLEGVKIRNTSPTMYEVTAVCKSGEYDVGMPHDLTDKYRGIRVSNFNILFKILGQGVDTDTDINIVVTNELTSETRQITITKGGEII